MSGDRVQRGLTIAVLGLIVLAVVVQMFLPGAEQKPAPHGASSVEPDGRRALRETLGRLGFAPEEWRKSPGALPRGGHVLFLVDAPVESERTRTTRRKKNGDPDVVRPSGRFDLQANENYRAFVEAGGTLVAPWTSRLRDFLAKELEFEEFELLPVPDAGAERAPRVARMPDGTLVTVTWPKELALPVELLGAGLDPYWSMPRSDGGEDAAAAVLRVGAGAILVLADPAFGDNANLGEEGNAEALVRLLEDRLRGGRVLFDEYALGRWEPETALGLAFSSALAPTSVHLLVLLALFVWAAAWARAFARDPEPIEQLSPLSRARAQANVLERAERAGLAAQILRRGNLARLARAARLARRGVEPGNREAAERELELAAARTLCEAELPAWRALFFERRVADEAELETLAADLDAAIERARTGARVAKRA